VNGWLDEKGCKLKSDTLGPKKPAKGQFSIASVLVIFLLVAYWFAQPVLNQKFGWNLPELSPAATGRTEIVETSSQGERNAPPSEEVTESELRFGLLREESPNRFLSPAGLLYTPGSEEGHRLDHLARHLSDQPERPGAHGVFDGEMEGALLSIDEAYEMAKAKKSGVQTEENGTRTIYTVNMGRRIGFVGGREGNRRNRPMSRRLRLVVEGNQVITAFPI
jgi:hypothetical protein